MTIRTFQAACQYLFPRTTGGIKWGLETTRALLGAAGEPQRHFAAVHVGGTNGKGSTAAMLAAMLRAAGHRTGLYTSPHLLSFTERIRVDGAPISEAAVAAWTERLRPVADARQASFFEITTAMAFADFALRGVEIAVVEVGLGGRLDATNVLEPLASGVTRIALDHMEYLGPTLEAIAAEKAHIAKPGVPFLTTEPDAAIAAQMLAIAQSRGAVAARVAPTLAAGMPLALGGAHQEANASLAVALARALPAPWRPHEAAIAAGLRGVRLAGRLDRRGPWLFDVAHNVDGVAALAGALSRDAVPRPLAAVIAILGDKDWRQMLALLAPHLDRIVLTRADSAAERSWQLDDVAAFARGRGWLGEAVADLGDALRAAPRGAATVLVTGSFTTVGDAMRRLGFDADTGGAALYQTPPLPV